jgi:peptidyl-prolyl cis-trans isomerase D
VPKIGGDTLDSLRTRVFDAAPKAKKDFAATAHALGVEVTKLEPVEAHGFLPGVGFSKRLVDWAFKAQPGDVSDPVGTDDAILIARLVAKNPKGTRSFQESTSQIRYGCEEEQRKQRARARLESVAAAVRSGTSLDAAAKAAGLKVEEPPPFNFYDSVAGVGGANEFTAVALALAPGKASGIVEAPAGAYILQIVSRDPFDEAAYNAQRQSVYQSVLSRRESDVYETWLKETRDHAQIKDHRRPRV